MVAVASVSLVVPFKPDGAERDRNWAWLREWWKPLGWEIVEGDPGPGEWCKARAVADALTRASGDVLVVIDADVLVDLDVLRCAVATDAPWVIPHRMWTRLTPEGTERVLDGEDPFTVRAAPEFVLEEDQGRPGGGCVVISRTRYEMCPLDPRFIGWGQEDTSWAAAMRTLLGVPGRLGTRMVHLWHPPQERMSRRVGSPEGRALHLRYLAARGRREQMERLVAEGAACHSLRS